MDSTELHYLTYDPNEIWIKMLTAYADAGGDLLYPGDAKEMLLRSVLADITQVFAGVDNALRMATLRYAVGEYLDLLGELRNCQRILAVAATAEVTLNTNSTGRSETLKAGTSLTADGALFYRLTEDITLDGTAQSIAATIECDQEGSVGNGLLAGTQMHLTNASDQINSIVTSADASGGNDAEDDETYRERIRQHGLSSVTTGSARQYENAAEAVSSVILDAKAVHGGSNHVNIYLILSSQDGAAALIASVEDALSPTDKRPLTDLVTVAQATNLEYTLNVTYTSDTGNNVISAIEAAAEEYKSWQNNEIGRAFNPDRLVAMIYQAGASRVIFGSGSAFNGGEVAYTEIGAGERCIGTITLTRATS